MPDPGPAGILERSFMYAQHGIVHEERYFINCDGYYDVLEPNAFV